MRALIVDDQPNVRLLLSHILRRKAGCVVTEAANGLEALDLLGRETFDLVVLDVMMPIMDGLETLEAIRRTPALRHLPVIVLSSVRDEITVRQLVRQGITAYLAKPLRPLDVAERMHGIMARIAGSSTRPPVNRVVAGGAPAHRVLAARTDLRPHVISATEQVFGMMLGLEVLAVDDDQPAAIGDDVACLPIRLGGQACDLAFTLTAPRGITERMTAQYLQASDVISDDDVAVTLREIVTIIGTRLQSALRQRGDDASIGEASVSRLAAAHDLDGPGMRVCYASPAQDLRFMTTLRAVPATRDPSSTARAAVGTPVA